MNYIFKNPYWHLCLKYRKAFSVLGILTLSALIATKTTSVLAIPVVIAIWFRPYQGVLAAVFFVFIATPRLELPVFYSLDTLFIWMTVALWLISPALLKIGMLKLKDFLIFKKELVPYIIIIFSYVLIRAYEAITLLSDGTLNLFGLFGYTIHDLKYGLLFLLFVLLIKNKGTLLASMKLAILAVLISSLISVGIYFDLSSIFLEIRDALIFPNRLYPELGRLPFHHHQSGLTPGAYLFSYHLALVIPLSFFLYQFSKAGMLRLAYLAIFCFFLLMIGIVGTRMTIISSLIGIAVSYYSSRKIRALHLIYAVVPVAVLVLILSSGFFAISERFESETIALDLLDKLYAQAATFYSLPSNIWGVGQGNVTDFEYLQALPSEIRLVHLPHFHFITTILFYGLIGIIASLLFVYASFKILKNVLDRARLEDMGTQAKMLTLASASAFISVMVNGMAHNPGPFFGDYTTWLALGWMLSLARTGNQASNI